MKSKVRIKKHSLVLSIVVGCSIAQVAPAIDVVVNSPNDDTVLDGHCTLREAILSVALSSPDCHADGAGATRITFDPGIDTVYLSPALGPLAIPQAFGVDIQGPVRLTLSGGTVGSNQFVIEQDAKLELDDVVLEYGDNADGGLITALGDLVMIGGAARFGSAASGGAISVHAHATFSGVEFSANTAQDGGAISIDGVGHVLIENSAFFANGAAGRGGAVRAVNGLGQVTIRSTSFIANRADGPTSAGGAISALGVVNIQDSVLRQNITTGPVGGGGADFGVGSKVNISDTEFRDNEVLSLTTSAVGGGFAHHGGSAGHVAVSRSNFSGNLAWVGGGAYIGPAASADFDNTTFTNNVADTTGSLARPDAGTGAALYADSVTVAFRNVTIKDNEGVSQLRAQNTSEIRFYNTVTWSKQGVLNCDGQGNMIDIIDSLQNPDAKGASCSLPLLSGMASSVFVSSIHTFKATKGPPFVPVTHSIWFPKPGGPLSTTGDKATCLDPSTVNGLDERQQPRAGICDIGAIDGL